MNSFECLTVLKEFSWKLQNHFSTEVKSSRHQFHVFKVCNFVKSDVATTPEMRGVCFPLSLARFGSCVCMSVYMLTCEPMVRGS